MLHQTTALLFDLDGTLADSLDGIHKSMTAAFEKIGHTPPAAAEIRPHIGAPLIDILRHFSGDRAEEVKIHYHNTYAIQKVGIKGTSAFPHIPEMLGQLKENNIKIFVATNKEQSAAEEVVAFLNLTSFCDGIYGTVPSIRPDKSAVIAQILQTHNLSPNDVLMIGDRKYDIEGADKNNVKTIGITWGYGTEAELRTANAAHIAHTPMDIVALIPICR